ncbi:hypothetical protein [Actinosynnema sp. NPDC020468]|uniref:hypothetical protein n=1 Tax=Actinosynnema sp. NPDC020468 TaxID=3154488 RepID=UPI0033EEF2B3
MITAARLLAEVDPLPADARLRHVARTARALPAADLDALLSDLAARDAFAAGLGVHAAVVTGRVEHLARGLDSGHRDVVRHAIRAGVAAGVPADAFLTRLPGWPTATRKALYSAVRRRSATGLADALLPHVLAHYGEPEAAALLAACSEPVVRAALPGLEHAIVNWTVLARRYPDLYLDFVRAELDAAPTSWWPAVWGRLGDGVRSLAITAPGRVLDLFELVLPHVPLNWGKSAGPLARHAPDRVAALLLDPRRTGRPPHGRPLWTALAGRPDDVLAALARVLDGEPLVRFLHALPPSRRAAAYAGVRQDEVRLDVLDELPTAVRVARARRLLGLREVADDPSTRLAVTARLDWATAREPLRAATARATADERAQAYPLYLGAAAATRDPAEFGAVLAGLHRLANEQDPVRTPALTALARTPSWLFRDEDAVFVGTLLVDALQARDCSWSTRNAVGQVLARLLREGVRSGKPALVDTALEVWTALGEHAHWLGLSRVADGLPRGLEHGVFEALRGRILADARRGRFTVLFELVKGLDKRAFALTEAQRLLDRARGSDRHDVVREAVRLWLRPPATRLERAEVVFRADPSTVLLPAVRDVLGWRRTDLLDQVFGRRLRGLFAGEDADPVPAFDGCFHRWLPRQAAAYAADLVRVASQRDLPRNRAAHAIALLGRVPGSVDLVRPFVASPHVAVAEAALAALAWTDDPAAVVPDLLAHAGTDRARVAVYAITRCARFTTAQRLADLLTPLLVGGKVTARKEAVRLLAEHRAPDAAARLVALWPAAHRDVRRALVSAVRWYLDDEAAWTLLEHAAGAEHAVAVAVLDRAPLTVSPRHRARYARLVRTVATSPAPDTAVPGLAALPSWSRWDAGGVDVLVDLVSDLAATATWRAALTALTSLVATTSDATPLLTAVTRLHARAAEHDAEPDRDLPARRRIGALAASVAGSRALREVAADLATALAESYRPWAVDLAAAAIPWDRPDAGTRLAALAALATTPTAARRAADAVTDHLTTVLRRLPEESVVALADGVPAPHLALAVTAAAGRDSGWPDHWRTRLRALRAHPDEDVREAALDVVTAEE